MDIDFFKAATDVFLEVEVNPKAADKFEQKYQPLFNFEWVSWT